MNGVKWLGAAVLALVAGSAAQAADKEPCGKGMVCASAPQTVVDAIQAVGYKAKLSKSKNTGNPMIESAASGYSYTIFFYECEETRNCASLQFNVSFEDDGTNSVELANLWNKQKRFSQMAFDDEDKSLMFTYDVTTLGGLNQKNFADVVDWWATILGELNRFFKEQAAEPK